MSKKIARKPVLLSQQEVVFLAGALGLYQQAMEKASYLAYGFTSEKQRGRMIDHGIDAIKLRDRLFKELER